MGLMATEGYRGFSLRDVAQAVGISHPAVIYHFPSKDALLMAVIERFEARLGMFDVAVDSETGDLVELGLRPHTLGALALSIMRLATCGQAETIIALDCGLAVEASSPSHPAHAHYRYRFQHLGTFLVAELTRLEEKGIVHIDVTPRAKAKQMIRAWYGTAVASRYPGDPTTPAYTIPDFLAHMGRSLGLSPDVVLVLAADVPDDLASIFARAIKIYRREAR